MMITYKENLLIGHQISHSLITFIIFFRFASSKRSQFLPKKYNLALPENYIFVKDENDVAFISLKMGKATTAKIKEEVCYVTKS